MALFFRKNYQKLEVLPFDTTAVQYGLFLNEKLIGCIRVVKPAGQHLNTNAQLIYGNVYGPGGIYYLLYAKMTDHLE